MNLVAAYVGLGALAAAKAMFEKVLGLDPSHAAAYYYLGGRLYPEERYDAAIDVFKTALTLFPDWGKPTRSWSCRTFGDITTSPPGRPVGRPCGCSPGATPPREFGRALSSATSKCSGSI
jgi:hypothetical protein